MQSEGKFLRYFKVVAPRAVSTFGAKIGHLSFIMMLDSSSYEVRSVSQHLCHFVRPKLHLCLLWHNKEDQEMLIKLDWK